MEILSAVQIREADRFTITHTPVASIDLMERAAQKCFEWFNKNIAIQTRIHLFCGPGNNGGDGLALARMLFLAGYDIRVSLVQFKKSMSSDCQTNLESLKLINSSLVEELFENSKLLPFRNDTLLVDAIFGTGFSQTSNSFANKIIRHLNESGLSIISIDLPSGINADKTSLNSGNEIIKASKTLTFQFTKLAYLVQENELFYGSVTVLEIGLLREALLNMKIQNFQTDFNTIKSIYKPKRDFSHKGNFGHALLISGGSGKMGAAVLAAQAYLKSGAALLTLLVPENGNLIIQTAVPEAMALTYTESNNHLPDTTAYSVIGAGPGIGTNVIATELIHQLLNHTGQKMVLDADALNILSNHPEWYVRIPKDSILTPHPGEFRRLAGNWQNDFEKLEMQRNFASTFKVFLILKGKNTSIACPDGTIWFNPTGNAGMAKGGSGDVLTGLLTGLLASGYSPFDTCILGTWLHGLAGDLAAKQLTREAMNAGDIIDFIPWAWKTIVE